MGATRLQRLVLGLTVLLATGAFVPLTGAPGDRVAEVSAAFSGANGRIAFTSDRKTKKNRGAELEIFTMQPDGTGVKQLTRNDVEEFEPAWSADGKRIAFRSFGNGNWDIYTMTSKGKNKKRLTDDPVFEGEPDWQPR